MDNFTVDKYDYDQMREALQNCLAVLHPGVVGHIVNNHGEAAGIRAIRAVDFAKAILAKDDTTQENEESYDCPIHGLMKGETDCPRC